MSKFLVILLVSVSLGNIFMIIAEHTKIEKKPYKVYPLILFWTSDEKEKLLRPTRFVIDHGPFRFYKTYNFTAAASIKQEFLFCPLNKKDENKTKQAQKDTEKNRIATVSDDDYRLVESREGLVVEFFKLMNVRAKLSRCQSEPKPFISKNFPSTFPIQEDGDNNVEIIHCGPDNTGDLYRYGYEIFINKEVFDKVKNNLDSGLTISKEDPRGGIINYEIYRFCFDRKNEEVIYAQHKLISPTLLFNHDLRRERKKHYDMSSENFGLEEFNYFMQREEVYSKKTSTEESDEPVESPPPKSLRYEAEQLVPADDFAFALWRKPTYHYVNVELMNSKLSKLWIDILQTIQTHAKMNMLEFNIYTRTYNIPEKSRDENIEFEDFNIVLEEHDTVLKPPHIWIKIVHLLNEAASRAVVIIVNNHKNEKLNSQIINQFCDTDYCKHFKRDEYPEEYQYIRCCSLNDKIQQLFNLNPKLVTEEKAINSLIAIPDLIDFRNTSSDAKKTTEAET